jgi:hypothetical protein
VEIPWYINRHTLIFRKRDGKPRMIGGKNSCFLIWLREHALSVAILVLIVKRCCYPFELSSIDGVCHSHAS